MKLTKHHKEIVNAIIEGKVYDITSYMLYFGKTSLEKHDLDSYRHSFAESKEGKQEYKVIIDSEKAYSCRREDFTTTTGTTTVSIPKFPVHVLKENVPKEAWTYKSAKLLDKIESVKYEYKGQNMDFDFCTKGVQVASNFSDIVEFMTLWEFLRQESLILEVATEIKPEDIGLFFEKHIKNNTNRIAHIAKAKGKYYSHEQSSTIPVDPVSVEELSVSEFYNHEPIVELSEYADVQWVINEDNLKNCDAFIGRKILPTSALRLYKKQAYTTIAEWRFRIPLWISIIALLVSLIPTVRDIVTPPETDYTQIISQQLSDVSAELDEINESTISKENMDEILNLIGDISAELDDIKEEIPSSEESEITEKLDEITSLIKELQTEN